MNGRRLNGIYASGAIEDRLTRQGEGVNVFAIVSACHVRLAETDSVFALGNAIENFEVLLGDALWCRENEDETVTWEGLKMAHPIREVHFHSKDADILGTSLRGISSGPIDVDTVRKDTVSRGHF